MIVLLDSNILIDVLRGRANRGNQLASITASGATLAVSVVTVAEIYAGMRDTEQVRTEALMDGILSFPVTSSIAKRAGLLKRNAAARGITLALPDTIIAATAIESDASLLTDNVKDFPFAELRLYDEPA